jgi:excisionase family DNA binding protein
MKSGATAAVPTTAAVPPLAELAAHPERVNELAPDVARTLLAQLATLQAPLLARALAGGGAAAADELLTIDVAARRLGLSEDWLYRHARKLPFTVPIGRQLRFSARRLEAYIAARANGRHGSP